MCSEPDQIKGCNYPPTEIKYSAKGVLPQPLYLVGARFSSGPRMGQVNPAADRAGSASPVA